MSVLSGNGRQEPSHTAPNTRPVCGTASVPGTSVSASRSRRSAAPGPPEPCQHGTARSEAQGLHPKGTLALMLARTGLSSATDAQAGQKAASLAAAPAPGRHVL